MSDEKGRYEPSLANAWRDGSWNRGLWQWAFYPDRPPRWYRAAQRLAFLARHTTERPSVAWRILFTPGGGRDVGEGWRAWLVLLRAALCAFMGRIDHGYPMYPAHPLSWDLAVWNGWSAPGYEYTQYGATYAAVCTGKAWHIHVYEDSGP